VLRGPTSHFTLTRTGGLLQQANLSWEEKSLAGFLLVLTQQVEPENINGRLDAAATPPAETSSVSGAKLQDLGKERVP
jgi:hypothetical protein